MLLVRLLARMLQAAELFFAFELLRLSRGNEIPVK